MNDKAINWKDIREIDIVEYLFSIGHKPFKVSRHEYWYCSPLRDETHPSFKVNRRLNKWYDFGLGKGGSLIDFGMLYFNCSLAEFLKKITEHTSYSNFNNTKALKRREYRAFHSQSRDDEKKVKITSVKWLFTNFLLKYLQIRRISLRIAEQYCKEVAFCINNKRYRAIGFQNNTGGFELRNHYLKISSSPKDITFLNNGSQTLYVFEGFFDFLSYLTIFEHNTQDNTSNYLVLNTLSFLEKSKPLFEQHRQVILFLDRDQAGFKCRSQLLKLGNRYKDASPLYDGFKDLNEFLMNSTL